MNDNNEMPPLSRARVMASMSHAEAKLNAAILRARGKFGKVVFDKKWEDGMKYASLESIERAIREPLNSEGVSYHFGDPEQAAALMPNDNLLWFAREMTIRGHGGKRTSATWVPVELDPKTNRVADNALVDVEVHSKRHLLADAFGLFLQEETPESIARCERFLAFCERAKEADLVGSA